MYRVIVVLILLFLASSCPGAAADPQPSPSAESPTPTPTPEPTPIPLAKIPLEAESTLATLQEISASASKYESAANLIGSNLANLAAEIDSRVADDSRLRASSQTLDTLHRMTVIWQTFSDNLSGLSRELADSAKNLDQEIARLNRLQRAWQVSVSAARQPDTPPAVLERAQSTSDAVARTLKSTVAGRASVLTAQTRLSEEQARVQTALTSVQQLQTSALKSLVVRDSPPIWKSGSELNKEWETQLGQTCASQVRASAAFTERLPFTFLIHVLVILVIAVAIQWMRRKIRKSPEKIEDLDRAMPIFDLPISAAFALSIIFVPSIYPQAPRLIQAVMGAVALIPTIKILRKLLHRNFYPILNALIVLYFIGQIRIIAASVVEFSRLMFIAEMLGGAIFIFWLIRTAHLRKTATEQDDRTSAAIRVIAKAGSVLFPAALVANIFGYTNLANLLGLVFLRSMFAAAALYSAIRIIEGLIIVGLQVRPLNALRGIRLHRVMLQRRTCRLLELLAFLFWLNLTLNFFGLQRPLLSAVEATLNASLSIGSLSVSPGRILAFVITVWASILVSRFLRFALEEDVYRHFQLARGIPYAISTLLHYVVLVVGFFMALGALGIDLTKITIVAGAFSVGVGFGLQNIFNNFVSGIILLFERPIKIGDVIEVSGTVGEVQHIGIRASVIRTAEGSEIIVPNGLLISGQVTNWTFSDRRRAVEVTVSVAAGSDLQRVTELLKNAAESLPGVAKEPAPQVYAGNFAAGAVAFQVRVWTDRYQDWAQVRSDLSVTLADALRRENINFA